MGRHHTEADKAQNYEYKSLVDHLVVVNLDDFECKNTKRMKEITIKQRKNNKNDQKAGVLISFCLKMHNYL